MPKGDVHMDGIPARQSLTVLTDHVLPPDTNNHNTMFGGKVMAHIDKVATMACMRHAHLPAVTASIDSLDFLAPIKAGSAICVEAFVTWTHNTSMEVFVKVESEDLCSGQRQLTGSAYMTFVAIGSDGRPATVPPVIPESDEEKWHHTGAPERYRMRKLRKQESLRKANTPDI
jgi:acyl-CoA hydrolase